MNPVIEAGTAGAQADGPRVRPARMDRPLHRSTLEPVYSDPHLEKLVAAAADQARDAARAEGYAAGWAQGRQAAAATAAEAAAEAGRRDEQRRSAETQRAAGVLAALAEATRRAGEAVVPEWAEVADTLAAGALQLASAALGRELASVDGALAESVRVAVGLLAEPGRAVVHVHPDDAYLLSGGSGSAPDGVRVVADPSVAPGSVVVLSPAQRVKVDLPAALAAAEEVLRS
jgi:flagellar assembly protein FliH